MADFLTAVSTKKVKSPEPVLEEVKALSIQDSIDVESAASALESLKSQPSQRTVVNALKYMSTNGFNLLLPEPLNASIAHQLVNDTIPHYWQPLRDTAQAKQFAAVLRNPIGIGHIITRLRSLIADSRQKRGPNEMRDPTAHIEELLDLLNLMLSGDKVLLSVLQDIQKHGKNDVQKKLIWREYLSQTASGRLLSITAEAEDALKGKSASRTTSWLADGSKFSDWLGRNIASMTMDTKKAAEYTSAIAELCSKALTIGYTGEFCSLISSDRY
jgi:telomere length regulation protein